MTSLWVGQATGLTWGVGSKEEQAHPGALPPNPGWPRLTLPLGCAMGQVSNLITHTTLFQHCNFAAIFPPQITHFANLADKSVQAQNGQQWFFPPTSHKKEAECELGRFKGLQKRTHSFKPPVSQSGGVGIHLLIFTYLFNLRVSRLSSVLRAWEISINKVQ